LAFSELSAGYMTEDYMQEQHVTDHVKEDHDSQYHVITKDHEKDHTDRQYVNSDQHVMLVR